MKKKERRHESVSMETQREAQGWENLRYIGNEELDRGGRGQR